MGKIKIKDHSGQEIQVEVRDEIADFLLEDDKAWRRLKYQKRHQEIQYDDQKLHMSCDSAENDYFSKCEIFQRKTDKNESLQKIHKVLNSCSELQRKRFLLYTINGYSMRKIGEIEGASKQAVFESISSVFRKIKEIL